MVGKILNFVTKIACICVNVHREISQHLENLGKVHRSAIESLLGVLYADSSV